MSKYQKINELIQMWEEYENGEKNPDYSSFGIWLHNRFSTEKFSEKTGDGSEFSREQIAKEQLEYYKDIELNGQVAALLVRLNRFVQYYSKRIFKDLPLTSNMDFGFLACVEGMDTPKKSEVIAANLVEITTGTEIIKRLIKLGLIKEVSDKVDKRLKRVKITAAGKKVFEEARKKLRESSRLITGNLSDEEKRTLVGYFIQLNSFHNELYYNQSHLSINELIEKNILKV